MKKRTIILTVSALVVITFPYLTNVPKRLSVAFTTRKYEEKLLFTIPKNDNVDFSRSDAFGVYLGNDGKTFAYKAVRNNKEMFFVNGENPVFEGAPVYRRYFGVSISSGAIGLVVSEILSSSPPREKSSTVYVNGSLVGVFSDVRISRGAMRKSAVFLSDDGQHYAFYAKKKGNNGAWILVRDGEMIPVQESSADGPYGFGPDAVLAVQGNTSIPQGIHYDPKSRLLWVKSRQAWGSYFEFSSGGKHFVFGDIKGDRNYGGNDLNERLFIDGTMVIRNVGAYHLSGNGNVLFYTVVDSGKSYIFRRTGLESLYNVENQSDEIETMECPHDWPWREPLVCKPMDVSCVEIKSNDQGTLTLCVKMANRYDRTVSVEVSSRKTEGPYNEVFESVFSGDGKHYAYIAGVGGRGFASGNSKKTSLILDGTEIKRVPAYSDGVYSVGLRRLAISRNGKHVAAVRSWKGRDRRCYVLVNDKNIGPFRETSDPFFEGEHCVFLALRDRQIIRVRIPPSQ